MTLKKIKHFIKKNYKELIAQLVIHTILFLFYSYNQDHAGVIYSSNWANTEFIYSYKFSFFMNYAIAGLIINYIFLPLLYYKKRFVWFFVTVSILIAGVILIDEFFLEQIYFPTTRGTYFPGIPFTLIETLPLIMIFVGFKLAWDFNVKQSEVERLKVLVKESELQFLKSQINPHFLFNNLNNLYAYATENSPKTPSIILELSSVLRYMLYDCTENYVLLSKEIAHLKNFTALNQLQIEDRGEISFTTNIESSDFLIAPLILNVFLENSFKHSTASQSNDIKIDVSINVSEQGILTFSCVNSFLEYSNNKQLSKGIGFLNVKKRLELIYPNLHELTVTSNNNIFNVNLLMHLKPNN